MNFYKNA